MKKEPLKLYVWEGVLCDYTCGMAVVLAHNLDEVKLIIGRDFPDYVVEQLPLGQCQRVTEPKGFYVYGGS